MQIQQKILKIRWNRSLLLVKCCELRQPTREKDNPKKQPEDYFYFHYQSCVLMLYSNHWLWWEKGRSITLLFFNWIIFRINFNYPIHSIHITFLQTKASGSDRDGSYFEFQHFKERFKNKRTINHYNLCSEKFDNLTLVIGKLLT
jgi:hypothetical protein